MLLRDGNNCPQFTLLEQSLKQDAVFVDTSIKDPVQVADEVEKIINSTIEGI